MFKGVLCFLTVSLMLISSNFAMAEDITAHQVVEVSSQKVLNSVKKNRMTFESNPDILADKLLEILEPVVAFDGIARSVTGKYRKMVTPEQHKRFAVVFKNTMVRLYAKALITFESDKIEIVPSKKEETEYSTKAKVLMNVTGVDGKEYKIVYSMRKNKKGEWQARNMIVDGINLGLTYLNQFDSAMNRYNQDIDKVIDSWQQDMDNNEEVQNGNSQNAAEE